MIYVSDTSKGVRYEISNVTDTFIRSSDEKMMIIRWAKNIPQRI